MDFDEYKTIFFLFPSLCDEIGFLFLGGFHFKAMEKNFRNPSSQKRCKDVFPRRSKSIPKGPFFEV